MDSKSNRSNFLSSYYMDFSDSGSTTTISDDVSDCDIDLNTEIIDPFEPEEQINLTLQKIKNIFVNKGIEKSNEVSPGSSIVTQIFSEKNDTEQATTTKEEDFDRLEETLNVCLKAQFDKLKSLTASIYPDKKANYCSQKDEKLEKNNKDKISFLLEQGENNSDNQFKTNVYSVDTEDADTMDTKENQLKTNVHQMINSPQLKIKTNVNSVDTEDADDTMDTKQDQFKTNVQQMINSPQLKIKNNVDSVDTEEYADTMDTKEDQFKTNVHQNINSPQLKIKNNVDSVDTEDADDTMDTKQDQFKTDVHQMINSPQLKIKNNVDSVYNKDDQLKSYVYQMINFPRQKIKNNLDYSVDTEDDHLKTYKNTTNIEEDQSKICRIETNNEIIESLLSQSPSLKSITIDYRSDQIPSDILYKAQQKINEITVVSPELMEVLSNECSNEIFQKTDWMVSALDESDNCSCSKIFSNTIPLAPTSNEFTSSQTQITRSVSAFGQNATLAPSKTIKTKSNSSIKYSSNSKKTSSTKTSENATLSLNLCHISGLIKKCQFWKRKNKNKRKEYKRWNVMKCFSRPSVTKTLSTSESFSPLGDKLIPKNNLFQENDYSFSQKSRLKRKPPNLTRSIINYYDVKSSLSDDSTFLKSKSMLMSFQPSIQESVDFYNPILDNKESHCSKISKEKQLEDSSLEIAHNPSPGDILIDVIPGQNDNIELNVENNDAQTVITVDIDDANPNDTNPESDLNSPNDIELEAEGVEEEKKNSQTENTQNENVESAKSSQNEKHSSGHENVESAKSSQNEKHSSSHDNTEMVKQSNDDTPVMQTKTSSETKTSDVVNNKGDIETYNNRLKSFKFLIKGPLSGIARHMKPFWTAARAKNSSVADTLRDRYCTENSADYRILKIEEICNVDISFERKLEGGLKKNIIFYEVTIKADDFIKIRQALCSIEYIIPGIIPFVCFPNQMDSMITSHRWPEKDTFVVRKYKTCLSDVKSVYTMPKTMKKFQESIKSFRANAQNIYLSRWSSSENNLDKAGL